ncbi:hypothetical protein KIH39_26305 [Telmatocola sphagniphila]|jgi:hypothetical protein|uniref:Uncharacterized protein n=1 Tax=Telmatocola sphagniphila TaxID=1123043 RepID=A0A8E6EV94_9BACT|nr:hypothetical protein [Telmatocola sphagniphila]QVL32302.1 hypothetical protein KIH39_26305 [Telmatocola sphagniphila]
MRSIAWLALIGGLPGLLASTACLTGMWNYPWQVPTIATIIVLIPAIISLGLIVWYRQDGPELTLVLMLVGTLLRMGAALGGGILAFYWFPEVREHGAGFAAWGISLYVLSLIAETVLGLKETRKLGTA